MKALWFKGLVVVALGLSGGGLAVAGVRWTSEVAISTTARWAQGAMGSARNSTDSTQYIACSNTNDYVYCSARNEAGTYVHCDAYSAALAGTLRGVDSSAFLIFYWTGAATSGTCSSITVEHGSGYAPKNP